MKNAWPKIKAVVLIIGGVVLLLVAYLIGHRRSRPNGSAVSAVDQQLGSIGADSQSAKSDVERAGADNQQATDDNRIASGYAEQAASDNTELTNLADRALKLIADSQNILQSSTRSTPG